MKNKLKLFGCTLIVLAVMVSCDDSEFVSVIDPEKAHENLDDSVSANGFIIVGSDTLSPLNGSLTNLPSENFESDGKKYYCFVLKLEKFYPGHVAYPNGSKGSFGLSYSINFKFFTEQSNGSVEEVLTVELLDDILPYYKAMDQRYAFDKKTVAFLLGNRSLNPFLDAYEYKDYMNSQIRIKTGTIHIHKTDGKYLISFDGETEKGEKVSCQFNDIISLGADNQLESREIDFSTTKIPENYIQKDGKYYQLNEAYYYIFQAQSFEGRVIQTVQVISRREYYWYEANVDSLVQLWKSSAIHLQFQFDGSNQFKAKTYRVTPSEGIHSMGYFLGEYRAIPFKGFPNDSLFIGYYHTAIDLPSTFTYNEDPNYMNNQIALQSGQLEVTTHSSEYAFSGTFKDAKGEELKVKFKAIPYYRSHK